MLRRSFGNVFSDKASWSRVTVARSATGKQCADVGPSFHREGGLHSIVHDDSIKLRTDRDDLTAMHSALHCTSTRQTFKDAELGERQSVWQGVLNEGSADLIDLADPVEHLQHRMTAIAHILTLSHFANWAVRRSATSSSCSTSTTRAAGWS